MTSDAEGPTIMMTPRLPALAVSAALALGACTSGSGGETVGLLGGAAGGALLGSQIGGGAGKLAAVAVGTLVGALAGREIARRFTSSDQERAAAAERQAIADNRAITWNDPGTGHTGTVAPQRTYTDASGRTCRVYSHRVTIDGHNENATGTACQRADGTWQLVS
jgi:surface antigen